MLLHKLLDLVTQAESAIMQTNNIADLESIRIIFLGKNGYINQNIKVLNTLKNIQKAKLGITINHAKQKINHFLNARKQQLESKIIENLLKKDTIDVTLPGYRSELGTFHPISNVIKRIKKFFDHSGFIEINGPEIDDNYFNFDALNIPMYHPSRNKQDTFWFDSTYLLRTHTSGMQIRIMSESIPPIRFISIGRVYRKDYDKHHTPMFHQIEGIIVDNHLSLSNLKKILYDFLNYFFEKKITLRFRSSYFPFTEPSAEIDIMVETQHHEKIWLELLGCGMIHPSVLYNVGIDSNKFSGLAFGIGIERLAMLSYQISDIRIFFENDLQFLSQFK